MGGGGIQVVNINPRQNHYRVNVITQRDKAITHIHINAKIHTGTANSIFFQTENMHTQALSKHSSATYPSSHGDRTHTFLTPVKIFCTRYIQNLASKVNLTYLA